MVRRERGGTEGRNRGMGEEKVTEKERKKNILKT